MVLFLILSNVVDLNHMFNGSTAIRKINLADFYTYNVTDTILIFNCFNKLEIINVSNNFDLTGVTN